MSGDVWDDPAVVAALAEAQRLHEYRVRQLTALARAPAAVRRKYTLLVVVCRRCGTSIASVMDLDPEAVLCFRQGDIVPLDSGGRRTRLTPIRRHKESMIRTVPGPPYPTGFADIFAMCRCRAVTLNGEMLIDDLREGKRKRTIP